MNSVGIDISKGRSTIAVMRPFGEVVISPFEVRHTDSELSELAKQLKSLNGETRVVMEATGNYHAPVAKLLHDAALYSGQWRWSKDRSIRAIENYKRMLSETGYSEDLVTQEVIDTWYANSRRLWIC